MRIQNREYPDLLTGGEVARLFRVNAATVSRWARAGKVETVRTPSGHLRYPVEWVHALLNGNPR